MALLVNNAGGTAADPILNGLRAQLVWGTDGFDVATVDNVWMDQAAGFPGTNSIAASLTPTTSTIIAGTTGSYDDTLDRLDIGSTTGVASQDVIYLSHAGITDGFYRIASVVNATQVTVEGDPMAGAGNKTNIGFQVAWSYIETMGTSPMVSSAGGTQNFMKVQVQDGSANQTQATDSFFLRDTPAGSGYVALDGASYTGQTFSDPILTLAILAAWTNRGGISHVELTSHSVQAVNNFTWTSGGGVAERTLALAESSGLTASVGDGAKYGRLLFKTQAGGTALGVDIDATIDTAGPNIVFTALGA